MGKTYDFSILFKAVNRISTPLKRIGDSFNKVTRPVKKLNASLSRTSARLRKLDSAFKKIERRMARSGFDRMGKRLSSVGRDLSLKMTLPLAIMGGLVAKTAIDFETAFTGVRKTVDATKPQFAILKKQLMDLALVIPVSTTELFGIAEAAGQLDIKRPNIAGFVKTIAALGIAAPVLEMQEAAIQLAQFAKITRMNQKDFDRLASVLVKLGNTTATTEDRILNMAMRLSAAGATIGLTQAEIFGLSAALAQLGLEAEAGGTAFSRVMRQMNKEIALGSKKVDLFAAVSEQSTDDFKKAWEKDSLETVIKFVEGLGLLEEKGLSVEVVLDELGMDAVRISDALTRASKAGDEFRKTIGKGNKEWKINEALMEELGKRLEDTASQLKMARNQAEQTSASFGDVMKPAILKVIEVLKPFLDWLKKLTPTTKKIIIIIGVLTAVIGPLLLILSVLATGFAALTIIGAPIIATVAAIAFAFGGISAAIYQVIKHWNSLKRAFSDNPLASAVDMLAAITGGILPSAEEWKGMGKTIGGWFSGDKGGGAKGLIGAAGASGKSQTDINIKLMADYGTSAVIESLKKKGNIIPNVATEAYVGAGAF